MSYIACPFCGGGVPGMPCRCRTPATPFTPFDPQPPATLPPTAPEEELLRRIEELEAKVARLLKGEE
jgi:hypothetical protein